MDLATLAQLGEFVGGFFVVVSLVYLAYQVRQNTKSLRAENYARVLDRLSTLQAHLSTDPELNRIVSGGALAPDTLSPADRVRLSWALFELLGAAEFVFHQAQDGSLPDQVWPRWRENLAWWLSSPGIQTWWESRPTRFSDGFESLVNELIRENPVDREAVKRWERFVSGEGTS